MKKITVEFQDIWVEVIDSYKIRNVDSRSSVLKKILIRGLAAIEEDKGLGNVEAKKYISEKLGI